MGAIFGNNGRMSSASSWTSPSMDHTIVCWNRLDSVTDSGRIFGNNTSWEWRHAAGTSSVLHEFEAGSSISATMNVGQLYHVALIVDETNTTKQVYLNGVVVSNDTSASFSGPASGILSVGSRETSTEYFDGFLEDLRIYDRILTLEEIQTIYACSGTDGIEDGLLNWWPMDEGAEGSNVTQFDDIVGGIHLGTLVGTAPVYSGDAGIRYRRKV